MYHSFFPVRCSSAERGFFISYSFLWAYIHSPFQSLNLCRLTQHLIMFYNHQHYSYNISFAFCYLSKPLLFPNHYVLQKCLQRKLNMLQNQDKEIQPLYTHSQLFQTYIRPHRLFQDNDKQKPYCWTADLPNIRPYQ